MADHETDKEIIETNVKRNPSIVVILDAILNCIDILVVTTMNDLMI